MFGGFEVRVSQIARELASRSNYRISVLVADHGQPHHEIRDGVTLVSWTGKKFWGIPHPNPPGASAPFAAEIFTLPSAPVSETEVAAPSPSNAKPRINVFQLLRRRSPGILNSRENCVQEVGSLATAHHHDRYFGSIKAQSFAFIHFYQKCRTITWPGYNTTATIFLDLTRPSIAIARNAVGNIVDEPVYMDSMELYKEIDADVYIAPGNTRISAEVSFFCHHWHRNFVMLAGSDMDFDPEFRINPSKKDIYGEPYYLKWYVLQNAHLRIVQNESQAKMACQLGLSAVIIRNPIGLTRDFPKDELAKTILWVGNTDERVKRPSIIMKLAQELSQYQFLMILTPAIQLDYDRLEQISREIPNLTIISRIPYREIERYFAGARLFINTSKFEGFPNTFLQAGKYGVPVLALNVDPNHMLSNHHCGIFCDDDQRLLLKNINVLMNDEQVYAEYSANILNYVREYHDRGKIIDQYEEVLRNIIKEA